MSLSIIWHAAAAWPCPCDVLVVLSWLCVDGPVLVMCWWFSSLCVGDEVLVVCWWCSSCYVFFSVVVLVCWYCDHNTVLVVWNSLCDVDGIHIGCCVFLIVCWWCSPCGVLVVLSFLCVGSVVFIVCWWCCPCCVFIRLPLLSVRLSSYQDLYFHFLLLSFL